MRQNFDAALKAFWTFDGAKLDSAPGEHFATSYGVTEMTWNYAVDQGIVTGDMDAAPIADYEKILHVMFWDACSCDSMPGGVDLMLFNDATLTGVGHTKRLLQRCLGVDDDGKIGPMTLAAIFSRDTRKLIDALARADILYLSALHNAPLYIRGWTRRETYMQNAAYTMIGGQGNAR